MRLCWTILCWVILLAVVGAGIAGGVLYSQLDNVLQKHILAELQKLHPDLHVQIGSAKIIENKGIAVKDVEFSLTHADNSPKGGYKLLGINEMFIECPITLQTLIPQKIPISRIVIKKPILAARHSQAGTFPELELLVGGENPLFFPKEGKPVSIEIEDGTVLYSDDRQPIPPIRLSAINLTLLPVIQDQEQQVHVQGSADGDFFRRLDVDGVFLPVTKQWQCTIAVRQFDWTDDLWQYLPQSTDFFKLYDKENPLFQGSFDFKVSAVSDADAEWGCRFAVAGTLTHGRLDLPELNRTITELSTRFEITDKRIVIDKLAGNSGSTRLTASFTREGFTFNDSNQQAELILTADVLQMDDELIQSLSPFFSSETKRLLDQYDFEGTTDLYAQLVCRGGRWQPKDVSMKVSELTFAARMFPYRIDHLAGNLTIDETEAAHFYFKSKQENPIDVEIVGHYGNIFTDATGKVEIVGKKVSIDSKLVSVLPPATQRLAKSLSPAGTLHARLVFELLPGNAPLKKQFDIALDHVSLLYEHFPYPLRDVTGLMHYDGTDWQFSDVAGYNGTAIINGSGYYIKNTPELVLHLSASELPIDDQIIKALNNPNQHQLLESLHISGKVNLATQIHYRTGNDGMDIQFQAVPCAGLSLCPDRFPYKIENVGGEISYENGRVFAEKLTATHRDTNLQSGLDCRFSSDGNAVLRLEPLAIDQLRADRELLDALPARVREFLETVQITQPFNLSGGIEYRQPTHGEPTVAWGLNWILHQNSAKLGIPVENLFGMVRLSGQSSAQQLWINGEFILDSLMIRDSQVTSIRGPFSFDGTRLQLGLPKNRLMGKYCGGTIQADALVVLGNNVTYGIRADLIGADLEKIAGAAYSTMQKPTGKLNCINLQLQGIGTKWETVSGTGTLQLREANIYGAPVMVQIFRELRVKEIDSREGMFSSMDYDFRLSGQKMFFNNIVFEGGLIFMQGAGTMSLENQTIDLTMKTRLGNPRRQIPVVSNIFGAAGDQLVQLNITGALNAPSVTRIVIPEIQKVLQQIQSEDSLSPTPILQERSAPSKMFPWNPL